MKKTLTVNLGGTVYHIDEDAYKLLDNYLNDLKCHFGKGMDAEEIVQDMEIRIAELFNEYIKDGSQVITLHEVEEVIARMGNPEELNDGMGEEYAADNKRNEATTEKKTHRLFRNPDDRILGGVLSGLSAYFGWDVTWLRIGVLVVGFFVHTLILAYLIAWIIIPLARTATEKLQMRGEPINVENIGRTVTDGFEKVNEYVHSSESHSVLHRIGRGIVTVAGFVIKVCLVILAIVCAPALLICLVVLGALLMVASGLITAIPAIFYHIQPEIDWSLVTANPWATTGFSICGLLAVGIPVVGLLQLVMQSFKVWTPMSTTTKVVLIMLWLLSIVIGFCLFLEIPFAYYW